MSYAFFWIPARDPGAAQQELNRFLGGHRVVGVERHFHSDSYGPGWSIVVEYLQGAQASGQSKRGAIDYREVLDERTFALYAALRTYRKQRSEAEGVPAYTIATNEQMAAIARRRPATLEELREIEGVGEAKVARYGAGMLQILSEAGAGPGRASPPGDADAS